MNGNGLENTLTWLAYTMTNFMFDRVKSNAKEEKTMNGKRKKL